MRSRERVKAYGEVFTPRYMVEQMIDLVADDIDQVDTTVLEPAAGDGNFLVAILERKLAAVERTVEPALYGRESLFALASIYGIELLEDNHADAQAVMLETFVDFHRRHKIRCSPRTDLYRAAVFLIGENIVRGNTLTGLDPRGAEIQLSWWHRVDGSPGVVQREPFRFAALRGEGMLDFTVYETYVPCPIEQVYQEARG